MVQICCVDGCDDSKEDITYFKFPNSRTLRLRWLETFKPASKVTIDSVVCSQHFLKDQYETVRGRKRLKAKVIPSIFHIKNEHNDDATQTEEREEIPAETEVKTSPTDTEDNAITTDENSCSCSDCTEKDREKETADVREEEGNKMAADTTDSENSVSVVATTINNGNDQNAIRPVANTPTIPKIFQNFTDDIEKIITNYLIRQIRPLNTETEKQTQEQETGGETEIGGSGEKRDGEMEQETIDVDALKDPVFIEVSVDKAGTETNGQTNQDCLMLLESVQCEVDPTSLVFQETMSDSDNSSDVIDLGEKKEDPISLLTSSDEDEVIIEEPEIDMVEVSDETDEDDMPLVKLVKKSPTKSKKKSKKSSKSGKSPKRKSSEISDTMLGDEYYCVQCQYKSSSRSEYKKHMSEHLTVIQICQICSYTTASKSQFSRHKKRHQDDRKFKCQLCDYKARYNMSLIYHMKTHENGDVVKIPFKHKQYKNPKVHKCRFCNYSTTRVTDLKRHVMRRHS